MVESSRRIVADSTQFVNSADLPLRNSLSVEGIKRPALGELKIRKLMAGDDVMMLEAFRAKGQVDPPHKHDDHESIGYLVSGKLRLVIDGREFTAVAGSTWRHGRGIEHSSEALEDCHQIEVKSPPAQTWVLDKK